MDLIVAIVRYSRAIFGTLRITIWIPQSNWILILNHICYYYRRKANLEREKWSYMMKVHQNIHILNITYTWMQKVSIFFTFGFSSWIAFYWDIRVHYIDILRSHQYFCYWSGNKKKLHSVNFIFNVDFNRLNRVISQILYVFNDKIADFSQKQQSWVTNI